MANADRWLVLTDYDDGGPILVDSRNIALVAMITPEPCKEEPDPEPRTVITLADDLIQGDVNYFVVRETPLQIGQVLDAAILYRESVKSSGGIGCG